jgi:TRAP-type C4-dicarboxylate transport system permease small subunit
MRLSEVTAGSFFVAMIVIVLLGIVWRYVLNNPLVWSINLATICFIWSVLIGAPLSDVEDTHLQFDLLYDALPDSIQLGLRLFGNLLILAAFGALIPGTVRYLQFVGDRAISGAPWLTFRWAFSCFLIFIVLAIIQRSRLLLRDLSFVESRFRQWREGR